MTRLSLHATRRLSNPSATAVHTPSIGPAQPVPFEGGASLRCASPLELPLAARGCRGGPCRGAGECKRRRSSSRPRGQGAREPRARFAMGSLGNRVGAGKVAGSRAAPVATGASGVRGRSNEVARYLVRGRALTGAGNRDGRGGVARRRVRRIAIRLRGDREGTRAPSGELPRGVARGRDPHDDFSPRNPRTRLANRHSPRKSSARFRQNAWLANNSL
jgi:hypothetical protein